MTSQLRTVEYLYGSVALFGIVYNTLTLRFMYCEEESLVAGNVTRTLLHVYDYRKGEILSLGVLLNVESFGKISDLHCRC